MEKLIQEMDESDVECGYFAVRNTEICGNEVIFELDTAYPGLQVGTTHGHPPCKSKSLKSGNVCATCSIGAFAISISW